MKEEIIKLRQSGMTVKAIAEKLGCSVFKVNYYVYPNVRSNQITNNKKFRIERKQRAIQHLGGKCQVCGYDKCLSALEFHHIDPNSKLEKLKESSGMFHQLSNWEDLLKEISKCALLCCRCHREVHEGIIKLGG